MTVPKRQAEKSQKFQAKHLDVPWMLKAIVDAREAGKFPYHHILELRPEFPPNVVWSKLTKMEAAGLVEYGVNLGGCWLTEKGKEELLMSKNNGNVITRFWGEHRYLSNFYLSPVDFEGIRYPSSEHAYVAAKTLDLAKREEIAKVAKAGDVKRVGRSLELRPDWEDVKVDVMRRILRSKFSLTPELGLRLAALAGVELIEGNTWGDMIWGAVWSTGQKKWVGTNFLGKLLMAEAIRLRAEHRLEEGKLTKEAYFKELKALNDLPTWGFLLEQDRLQLVEEFKSFLQFPPTFAV